MRIYLPLVYLTVLTLTGCGGGGGSTAAPPEPSPVALNDQVNVDEESSVSIDVTANDSLVDESSVTLSSEPANGSVELSDGQFIYTPSPDFSGSDSFQYSVTGDNGATLSATVSITVIDINDAPIAVADNFTIVEDNPLLLSLAENDTDIDGVISAFEISGAFAGEISGSGRDLVYTPSLNFVGEVKFSYRAVDEDGAVSNSATVTITIQPVTITSLEALTLEIPRAGYSVTNDAELSAPVLASAAQQLTVPPNVVSVLLTLTGSDANITEGGLFISSLVPPSGPFFAFQRFVNFCFGGNCSSLVPRSPVFVAESGVWSFQLGTLSDSVDRIDFNNLTLTAVFRTGPTPDKSLERPALLRIRPFLTADTVNVSDIAPVLARLVEIGGSNQIEFVLDPVTVLGASRFTRVNSSFLDADTSALVSEGDADRVNLFFLESFLDTGTLAGTAGGIPGSFGTKNGHNGILINTVASLRSGEDFNIQETAETIFHEMGHLLGLYHTTEALFSNSDVIDDTPNCDPDIHDVDGDGVADLAECPDAANPMFWRRSALIERGPLTDGQKHVLFYSPIAVPNS